METIHDLAALPTRCRGGVLSIGKFDGLHCGHLGILRALVKKARQFSLPSIVFTFDPAPAEILRPHLAPPLLCDTNQKIDLISAFDPDILIVFPTTRPFLELSAESFFHRVVIEGLGATSMIEGASFNFGRNRSGNRDVLRSLCSAHRIELEIIPSVSVLGREVSSSRIRSLLRDGQVDLVRGMLKRPYRITGVVVHGDRRGGTLGYPTANIKGVKTLMPKPGVYAARVLAEGQFYPAAVNLGGNPTFGVTEIKTEVHILDFSGDLYGKTIQVDFISRLREIIPFENRDALLAQMDNDIAAIRRLWSKWIDSDRIMTEEDL